MSNIYVRLLLNTDKFDKNLFKAQKGMKGFAASTKGIMGSVGKFAGLAGAFLGVSTSIHDAVVKNMEFEKSLSSLRSLTGVSAKELEYFRIEAIRMGMDSTQSASQMVEAFKLIGSQMPDLLKNKEALTQTAEAAVVLAEAAELDVPTAAKALTGSLNQMGTSSAHATEYINILAAASMQGSADIPYLNKAIENAGGAASSVGVKFNELVASIEAIVPKITDAGSAGTNLRNIFLTLEGSTDSKLRPSVVGLSKSLENLSKMNMDATQLTKMFGKESVTAALALLKERDAFEQLRTGIEGTNTAYEQAEINNDNLAGSIGKLQSSWTSFINTMAGSNGITREIVEDVKYLIDKLVEANMTAGELADRQYQDETKIEVRESNRRINKSISSGLSPEEALTKELKTANFMYPEAIAYQSRLNALKKAEAVYEKAKLLDMNDVAEEELQAYREAEKLFKLSEREYRMRQAIYDNVEAQRKELEAAKKKQEELDKKVKGAGEDKPLPGSSAYLDNQITAKRKELSLAVSDESRLRISRELDELVKQRRYMDLEVKYTNGFVVDTRQSKEMAKIMKLMKDFHEKAQLPKDFGKEKIKSPFGKEATQDVQNYGEALNNVGDIFGSLGSIMQGNADNMAEWVLTSTASIFKMIAELQALATAQGVASASALPFPANLAAIATVVATIASVFSSLPKFADGGIVGGSSFFGDKLLARVNSGEMILNKDQQRSLYKMTENGMTPSVIINIDKVRGADIYMSLRNYMKKTGKKL